MCWIYVPGLTEPVVVRSSYERTSDLAQFNIYNPNMYPTTTARRDFIVRDGEPVVGVMDDTMSRRTAAAGDRFTLRVTELAELEGATIEGHVSQNTTERTFD